MITLKQASEILIADERWLHDQCPFVNTLVVDSDTPNGADTDNTIEAGEMTWFVRVGTGDVYSLSDVNLEKNLVRALVTLNHEVLGHCCQQKYQFLGSDELSKRLYANQLATWCSDVYYRGVPSDRDQNTLAQAYVDQPIEIAAEYAGFVGAFHILQEHLGYEEANRLICKTESLFVPPGEYSDIHEILDALNQRFEQCLNKQSFIQTVDRVYRKNVIEDVFTAYCKEKVFFNVAMLSDADRKTQDMVLAHIYNEVDPDNKKFDMERGVPALKDIERCWRSPFVQMQIVCGPMSLKYYGKHKPQFLDANLNKLLIGQDSKTQQLMNLVESWNTGLSDDEKSDDKLL